MSLVTSLLQAVVRVDGDALVMHAGDKPYVVSPTGQVDLASRGLTLEAVNGIVSQLLTPELQNALDEFGAVQHELAPLPDFPGEHFTIVAARGGDDVWAEIRRRRIPEEDRIPEDLFVPSPMHAAASQSAPSVEAPAFEIGVDELRHDNDELPAGLLGFDTPQVDEIAQERVEAGSEVHELDPDLQSPDEGHLWPDGTAPETPPQAPMLTPPPMPAPRVAAPAENRSDAFDIDADDLLDRMDAGLDIDAEPKPVQPAARMQTPPPPTVRTPKVAATATSSAGESRTPPAASPKEPSPVATPAAAVVEAPKAPAAAAPAAPATPPAKPPLAAGPAKPPLAAGPSKPPLAAGPSEPYRAPRVAASVEAPWQAPPFAASAERPLETPPPQTRVVPPPPVQPAVVLNMSRNPVRSEAPPPAVGDPTLSGLERLLRLSAARGASTLYLSSNSRPSVRVDGELQVLDGEPLHVARDVESLLLTLMPERNHEAMRIGAATEWICDLEGLGRVRCMSFRDQRGPGGVFRMMPTRSVSADQLGLPKQVQALAIEPEGLILIAGPRSSGKRTTMSAFVDLMNRTRRDHIITIEREINIQHERGTSFISQREVRGSDDDLLAAARAAMREDPDVLVIEDLRTGALMNVALEAAAAGRLVIAGFSAHTCTGAIDRIIDLYAPEYRRQVQMALADSLRAVIAQVLLRKIGGGRLPAREVLLNTPAVSSVIAEGKTSQLPMAIEGGRRYGMMPLNDALVGLVQNGSVEAREAYRNSPDRPGFLAALNRNGIDTSFVERLANG